jgi:uncharacterized protein (TIGR00725 family)
MSRLPIVGVMGSGTRLHLERASALGRWLAECGVHLLTGGGGGVMAAVSKSFYDMPNRRGLVIGILPCEESPAPEESRVNPKDGYPNHWVEIPVQTHLPLSGERGTEPLSRNHINVLTSDLVVALPGGAGTLSEVQLAIRYERPVIAFVESHQEIPGLPDGVPISTSLEGVQSFVVTELGL